MAEFIPIYKQVELRLREMLANEAWHVGDTLPSRRKLADEFHVSIQTLQMAITPLVEEGLLCAESRRGGTVVAHSTAQPQRMAAPPPPPSASWRGVHRDGAGVMEGYRLGIVSGRGWQDGGDDQLYHWHTMLLHTIEDIFAAAGGITRSVDFLRDTYTHTEAIERLMQQRMDAIIVIGVHDIGKVREETSQALSKVTVPSIYLTASPLDDPIPHIFIDQRYSGCLAARHLLDLGVRRLLYYSPFHAEWITDRLAGVRRTVDNAGASLSVLPRETTGYHDYDWNEADFAAMVRTNVDGLLDTHALNFEDGLLGIIAANDYIACPLLEAVAARGFIAGRHYAAMGFDDSWSAHQANLTSMRPPLVEMGRLAANSIIHALQGEPIPHQQRIASNVIRRESTRFPRPLAPWERESVRSARSTKVARAI